MTRRPVTLNDYVGQERIKRQLAITLSACSKLSNPVPHVLLYGPPGLGKTTLARIIAGETGVTLHEVMASNINTIEDLEAIFANISTECPDIIFIDEIHRLPMKIEELLYQIMEDFTVEIEVKDAMGRKTIQKCWIPPFTLIGATTLAGDLSQPLRDRFGLHFQLQKYQESEVEVIVSNIAIREGVAITADACADIARRSKGTARVAINYYNRCKEYAAVFGGGIIDDEITNSQFDLLGIDEIGLDQNDYQILEYLATQSNPIGLDTLAISTGVDKNTVATMIEPYLIQKRLIDRTSRGRRITQNGLDWIYKSIANEFEDINAVIQTSTIQQPNVQRFGARN